MNKMISLDKIIGIKSPFSHIGKPYGVYENNDLLVITSTLNHLGWPSRTLYGGNPFSNRVSIYESGSLNLINLRDTIRFKVNHVAFHPNEPVIALACGQYDGGYQFEGELLVWDWENGKIENILKDNIDVRRVRFSEDGRFLDIVTTPPFDECYGEEDVPDELYLHKSIPLSGQNQELKFGNKVDLLEVGFESSGEESVLAKLRSLSPSYEQRSHTWDVSWIKGDEIACVTEEKQFELWTVHGERKVNISGEGNFGAELLSVSGGFLVNVVNEYSYDKPNRISTLKKYEINNGTLEDIKEFGHTFTMSASKDGSVLLRDTGYSEGKKTHDQVYSKGQFSDDLYLGHYDAFNHYSRLNHQESLYFLRGTPKDQHENKVLCSLDPKSSQVAELLKIDGFDNGKQHFLEGSACILENRFVSAFLDYNASDKDRRIFIREFPTGDLLDSFEIEAQISVLEPLSEIKMVFFALTNGEYGLIDPFSNPNEAKVISHKLILDDTPSSIISGSWNGESLAAGTICGRILVLNIDEDLNIDVRKK